MKRVLFSMACVALLPLAASAENAGWSGREICRAATKTYFFLDNLPADAPDTGGRFGFRSAKGNLYTCRIEGNVAAFHWLTASGQEMESRSTTFALADDRLVITTDILEERFAAP